MKHHETIHGERVAMAWHLIWAVLCFNTLCFSLGVLAMVWPYLSVGKALLALACSLVGQSVMSAGGTLWHILASLEHKRVIVRLSPAPVGDHQRLLNKVLHAAVASQYFGEQHKHRVHLYDIMRDIDPAIAELFDDNPGKAFTVTESRL